MKSAVPPTGYRPGVGVMLLDANNRVFIGRRIGTDNGWQMPQGGVDAGESPRHAALRELKEEIGTDQAGFVAESAHWLSYDFPLKLRPTIWGGRFKGQAQKWFLMRFTGGAADIRLDAHPAEIEFDAWKWVAPSELPALAIDFKRALYKELIEEFGPQLDLR